MYDFNENKELVRSIKSWFNDYEDDLKTNDWSNAFDHAPSRIGTFLIQELKIDFGYIMQRISNIPYTCFADCDEIKGTITITSSHEVISRLAFKNCKNIEIVSVGSSIVKDQVFFGCSKLRKAWFSQLETLPPYIFQNCSKLQEVYFPKGSSINSHAFYNARGVYQRINIFYKNEDLLDYMKNNVVTGSLTLVKM